MKNGLIYPELSYSIMGIVFDVFNHLGPGYKEKYYHNALSIAFTRKGINYETELYSPIKYQGLIVGKQYLDFLIEKKIVLEIKVGNEFRKSFIEQILSYLKSTNLQLGILINFTKIGIKSKRILNIY